MCACVCVCVHVCVHVCVCVCVCVCCPCMYVVNVCMFAWERERKGGVNTAGYSLQEARDLDARPTDTIAVTLTTDFQTHVLQKALATLEPRI